jgi:hypothetical protein
MTGAEAIEGYNQPRNAMSHEARKVKSQPDGQLAKLPGRLRDELERHPDVKRAILSDLAKHNVEDALVNLLIQLLAERQPGP